MHDSIQRLKQAATPGRLRQLWYAPPLATAMALTMVRLLVVARILSVNEFAIFSNGLLVSSSFCMLGCFGLQMLLQRSWPMMIVRGQEYRGLVLAAQANLIAIASAIVCVLLVVLGLSIADLSWPILYVGILHGLSQQLFVIATIESRSRGHAIKFATQNFVRAFAIFSLGIIVALATKSALPALLTEGSISFILSLFFFRKSATYTPSSQAAIYGLALKRFRKIHWNAALTLMAVSIVVYFQTSIDRWIASSYLSAAIFAQYSFAAILLSIGQSAQVLINSTLYPFIARRYAQLGQISAFKISALISLVILICGLIAAVPAGFILHYAITAWYPRYTDATILLPVFLVVATLRLSDFWSGFMVLAHRQSLLFMLNAIVNVIGVGAFFAYMALTPNHAITIMDIGLMAAALTLATYVATAVTAGLIGRKAC